MVLSKLLKLLKLWLLPQETVGSPSPLKQDKMRELYIKKFSPHMVHSESSKMAAVIFLLSKLFFELFSLLRMVCENQVKARNKTKLLIPGDEGKQATHFVIRVMASSEIWSPHW